MQGYFLLVGYVEGFPLVIALVPWIYVGGTDDNSNDDRAAVEGVVKREFLSLSWILSQVNPWWRETKTYVCREARKDVLIIDIIFVDFFFRGLEFDLHVRGRYKQTDSRYVITFTRTEKKENDSTFFDWDMGI